MEKEIKKIIDYYETHEKEGGTEQVVWEIMEVVNRKFKPLNPKE